MTTYPYPRLSTPMDADTGVYSMAWIHVDAEAHHVEQLVIDALKASAKSFWIPKVYKRSQGNRTYPGDGNFEFPKNEIVIGMSLWGGIGIEEVLFTMFTTFDGTVLVARSAIYKHMTEAMGVALRAVFERGYAAIGVLGWRERE